MDHKLIKPLSIFILLAVLAVRAYAEDVTKGTKPLPGNVNGTPSSGRININQISTWFYNNGISDLDNHGNAGFVYPKGTNKTAFFQSGFVWGGKVNGNIRVGGTTYTSGLLPGAVKNGTPENPAASNVHTYRVRRDYKTGSMNVEVRDGEGADADIRARYENDWNTWPAEDGAPYDDVDGNGKYDPTVDIPGVPGADQTIWFVNNDFNADTVKALYGSEPLGLECQTTVWGYNVAGPMGNTIFRKYKIINKGQNNITDMYASMWTDPDLGDATDDFAGCDTTLSLSYIYNGSSTDAVYSGNPPAAGFGLFQGPIVPGAPNDSAVFNGRIVYGKKNLPMTAFYYFIGGAAVYDVPQMGNYNNGTLYFYNLLQGKLGPTGEYFPVPASLGGGKTRFPLSGDPVNKTGFLDGIQFPKGDRRFGMASGPFNMAPGDVQEAVFAQIIAGGPASGLSNIKAVEMLKNYVKAVRQTDGTSSNPSLLAKPSVTAAEMDKEIILDWGSNESRVKETEAYNYKGFQFEGYNVYQLPSADASSKDTKRIATFDVQNGVKVILGDVVDPETGIILKAIQQYGNDTGIKRNIKIDKDYITGQPLENGREYYFAVTAYSYNPDLQAVPNNIENPFAPIKVVPHAPGEGEKYYANYGDTVNVIRLGGKSDGRVLALVVNPKALTGHSYQVSFDPVNDLEQYLWRVVDLTTNEVKVSKQINQSGNDAYLTIDGMLIKVLGPENQGIKSGDSISTSDKSKWGWSVLKGERRFTWSGANGLNLEGFKGAMGAGTIYGTSAKELKNLKFVLAATDTLGSPVDPNDPNVSYAYRYVRAANLAIAKPEFEPFIINKQAGYPCQDFKKVLPLAVYDIEDPSNPKRLSVGFLENNVANGLVDGKYWPPKMGNDNFSISSPREWLFVFDIPYSETPNSTLQVNTLSAGNMPVLLTNVADRNSSSWPGGDELGIYVNHINTDRDSWRINTDYLTTVKSENIPLTYEMFQNYPNPFNPVTTISYSIPERSQVELKVYDILGREVMTLVNKEQNAGRYKVQFDAGRLSSGIYIYRISAKNFTRTSKMVLLK